MTKNESHNEAKSTKSASAKNSTNPLPWITGAILLLGLAVLGGLYWSSQMKVQQMTFEGNYFVSNEDLEMVDVPTGMNPDSIDFGKLRNRFKEIPYVKQADISVEPSGNLTVGITERQPIAMIVANEKKIYIDEEGIRLPMVLGKGVDVPILYGFSATPLKDTLKSEAFRSVSNFLQTVQDQPVSNATISEIAWTKEQGIVALTNQDGVRLIFGKGDFETRLRNWEAFYGKVIKQKGIAKMKSVDLRFQGQIVTREQ